MVDPKAEPNDSSKPVIQILIVLVAILSLLLFVSLLGIGLLVAWHLNSEVEPEINAVAATDQPAKVVETVESNSAETAKDHIAGRPKESTERGSLAALPASLDRKATTINESLAYKLDRTKPLSFDYSFGLSFKNNDVNRSGRITYRFLDDDPLEYLESVAQKESEGEDQQPFSLSGNGTGFVVHPDGLLVTCAHVVEGVDTVSVKLEDKIMPGIIVERDLKHDLALIKVETDESLPFLKLASQEPNLGSTARVFGFPLADKLGRSMKLTTGTVTGRDEVNESTRLQLDATANPGNSGGPVTNNDGVVLGVVDSILAGGNVADLSFAVPVDKLQTLLSRLSVAYCSDAETNSKLAISKLDEVSRAVAMVEVSDEQLSKSWKVVDFFIKSRHKNIQPRNMRSPFRIPGINPSSTTKGKIVVNSRGKVIYSSESQILPGIVQGLSSIGLTELPFAPKDNWSNEETFLVQTETTQRESQEAQSPFGSPFRSPFDMHPGLRHSPFGPRFSPFGEPPAREVTRQSVRSVTIGNNFEIESRKPKYEIRHTRKISSLDLADSKDKDSATFRGAFTFDPEMGWPESGELKGHIKRKIDEELASIKVTYSYRKVSDAKLEAEKRKRDEIIAKHKERRQREQVQQAEESFALDELAGDQPGFRDFKFTADRLAAKDRKRADTPRVIAKIPKGNGQGKVAISPDGTMVAIGQFRGVAVYRINEAGDGFDLLRDLGRNKTPGSGPGLLKFSGNSKRLIVGEGIRKTRVFELDEEDARPLAAFNHDKAIAVSNDGNRLAFHSDFKRRLVVVDVDSGREILNEEKLLYDLKVHDAQFSSDGRQLLVAQGDRSAVVDIEQKKVVATHRWPFSRKPREVKFEAAGTLLIGNQQAFHVETGESIRLPRHDDDCSGFCGSGIWFVHLSKKFEKNIQFHKIDQSERYQIDTGADSGHWDSFAVAEDTNRVVALETFSESVFVVDF